MSQPSRSTQGWLLWILAGLMATVGVAVLVSTGPETPAQPSQRVAQTDTETASTRPAPSSTSPTPPPSLPPATSTSSTGEQPDPAASDPPGPATDPAWRVVAEGFVTDFTERGSGHQDWLARVSKWTTEELAGQLASTDPARIPSAALEQWEPVAIGPYAVEWTATYDTGLVLYGRVELGPAGWRVTSVLPGPRT